MSQEELKWFIGRVKSCQEKRVAEKISQQGFETFVPIQKEQHQWSDRKKWVDVLLLHGYVFFRCTEPERLELLTAIPMLVGTITDRTPQVQENGQIIRKQLVVPDNQMRTFMMMCQQTFERVTFAQGTLMKGDWVRVTQGAWMDQEFILTEVKGQKCIAVNLHGLGCGYMHFDSSLLERIPKDEYGRGSLTYNP